MTLHISTVTIILAAFALFGGCRSVPSDGDASDLAAASKSDFVGSWVGHCSSLGDGGRVVNGGASSQELVVISSDKSFKTGVILYDSYDCTGKISQKKIFRQGNLTSRNVSGPNRFKMYALEFKNGAMSSGFWGLLADVAASKPKSSVDWWLRMEKGVLQMAAMSLGSEAPDLSAKPIPFMSSVVVF